MLIKQARYIQSTPTVEGCPPPDKPEFAFVGRSNVGKSSLINLLTGRKGLAQTSNTPGKTRNLNHFIINEEWYLVDLPGYGFAKISQTERQRWQENMEEYLKKRENLTTVFLLVDSNIPPQKKDLEFAQWLGANKIPFSIVYTKSDKPKENALNANIQAFLDEMRKNWEALPPVFLTSADKKIGKDELLEYIAGIIDTVEFKKD